MSKDIVEKTQKSPENDRDKTIEKKEEDKEWKDIINLPDDLDFEVH